MEENAYLVLGCYGRTENGFVLCPSTDNRILKLGESLVNIEGVMNYLDAVKIFDRPMLDNNSIRHTVYHLQDKFDQKFKRLWNDHEFSLLERFMHMHKPCGMYLQVILVQEEMQIIKPDEEEISFVRGYDKNEERVRKVHTGKVRTRK